MPGMGRLSDAVPAPPAVASSDALPNTITLRGRVEELPTLPTGALQQTWMTAWGAPPPKGARRRFLMLGIAWRWQLALLGGPSLSLERRLAALKAAWRSGQKIESDRPATARPLLPGTRLVRDWRGERHEVHVVENGFVWRGQTRRSLSAIASEIAGGRRNGPAFFGLRDGSAAR